jgi:hypothetical protein
MKWLLNFLLPMRRKTSWNNPDDVKVEPRRYTDQVRAAFWHACARLETVGIKGTKHGTKTIKVIPGTVKRPAGWAVPMSTSPSGYAGGWAGGSTIAAVCDPGTGVVSSNILSHEWAHSILSKSSDIKTTEAQHDLMRKCGLM